MEKIKDKWTDEMLEKSKIRIILKAFANLSLILNSSNIEYFIVCVFLFNAIFSNFKVILGRIKYCDLFYCVGPQLF